MYNYSSYGQFHISLNIPTVHHNVNLLFCEPLFIIHFYYILSIKSKYALINLTRSLFLSVNPAEGSFISFISFVLKQ